ncbi:uncharacterized protein LOC107404861 [Ziziphus jujuba]|uniref:Uncharacterized protein LOC107404861 n=2 Tax=Ziziphus jujuba TaxID=326968 RepID=A0A6P3YUB4_ZIZJJ|nr:uncharacterized protein LOC107404861 [Ziziphus jujuba]KAH7547291.1 hypothetical protein FEM48_Zijuj01G0294100 [Ziziphus jujuba var. spinosa]
MFDTLLKPKFYNKCKQCIKTTKTRLDAIKKKRNAVQKYLRSDIADLLRSGLDINAYGRAEGLLVEQIRSSCYELIENFCGIISNNLSLMLKQKECPEECREAVPSLMYAAARFADLPELRDLRNLFTEKYGNSLECYINKEFVEMLRPKHPSKEMKLQLMQDIAKESSIEWESKALEQKLFTPSPMQEQPKYGSMKETDNDLEKAYNSNEDALSRGKTKDDYNASKGSENVDSYKLQSSSSEDETTTDISLDAPQKSSSSIGSVSEDEVDSKKPFYLRFIPPPYLKPKTERKDKSLDHDLAVEDKPKPRSVRRRNLKPPSGREVVGSNEMETDGVVKTNSSGKPRRGLSSIEANDSDDENRVLDGLLMHYSKKRSPYESGKPKSNPKSCMEQNDDEHVKLGIPPARASSMPPETTSASEAKRGHVRATSLQPEMLSTAGHVHPKLPEYEDLAARIAALRGA